jgi:hypothetical protein
MRIILSLLILLAMLTGCAQPEKIHFTEFVNKDVEKFTFRNGAGVTYSTTDKELINRFINIMDSTTYTKTKNPGLSGSSRLTFYGAGDKEIVTITFVGDYFYINHDNVYYETLPNKELESFYQEFLIDENIVK